MRLISTILFSFILLSAYATEKHNEYKLNKALNIIGFTPDGKPENWMRHYGSLGDTTEKLITISAEFPISDIRAIRINDLNATKGICGPNQLKDLLYLSFNQNNNIRKITTRIHKPCFYKNKATFNLYVVTKDGKRYYNTSVLTAHPDAFNWSRPSD